jgi:hypothetical protein
LAIVGPYIFALMVKFGLTPPHYVCFLGKVLPGSPALIILKNANPDVLPDGSLYYIVECDDLQAEAFLQMAKDHCRDAVPVIHEAIRRSHPTR